MNPEHKDVLFLDIETVSCTDDFTGMDERLKTLWARRASYLRKDVLETDEDLFHTRAGIYAEFGKIVCIGVGKFTENEGSEITLRTKAYSGDDEKALLLEFKEMLEKLDPTRAKLCAHNGKEFDFPYLCRRMLVNGIALPALLNMSGRKPWDIPHLDTMEMWKFGDHKNFTSLDLLATIFNIPSSKTDMHGSKVNYVYYKENGLEKITKYCVSDVVVLAQLYLRLKGESTIEERNIVLA